MTLTGQQLKILREGIVAAYSKEELGILLAEEMGVSFDIMARGSNYNVQVSNLIQDFVAAGRSEEFVKVIGSKKPNSPFLQEIMGEFAVIIKAHLTGKAFLKDTGVGTDYSLSETETTLIGRSLDCQITLNSSLDSSISRHHAAVRPLAEPNQWEICALDSDNGTFVNGERLRGCQTLQAGDRLTFGQSPKELLFAAGITPPPANFARDRKPQVAPPPGGKSEGQEDGTAIYLNQESSIDQKHITAWISEISKESKELLRVHESYTLNFVKIVVVSL